MRIKLCLFMFQVAENAKILKIGFDLVRIKLCLFMFQVAEKSVSDVSVNGMFWIYFRYSWGKPNPVQYNMIL